MDLEKISALFEKRLEKIEKDFKEQATQVNSLREEAVKQNEVILKLREDNTKLREEVVLVREDNLKQNEAINLLYTTVSRLEIDNAEARGDLRILHPLPYARLHLQHCIERQEACNAELNAFHHRYLTDTIISNPVLAYVRKNYEQL